MKIKIKLDRDQLKGLITILQILTENAPNRNIIEFLAHEELLAMRQKYTTKLVYPTAKFILALTNYQVALLFELLNECADNFMPFEKNIALVIIAQIDRQYYNHLSMLLNFSTENENNLLLSEQKQVNLQ